MVLGNVYVLPGVPEIYRVKLEGLRARLRGDDAPFVLRSVYTTLDEGEIKDSIDAVVERFADVSVGSYPRWRDADYAVRVTFDGRVEARVIEAAECFPTSLPEGTGSSDGVADWSRGGAGGAFAEGVPKRLASPAITASLRSLHAPSFDSHASSTTLSRTSAWSVPRVHTTRSRAELADDDVRIDSTSMSMT